MTSDGDDERTSEAGPLAFLAGGGEMGERTRAFDWSKTPLGPAAAWPHSLKTAVQIMLNSRYPMFLAWGRRLTFFYNDAYIPVLGQRHPAALGMSAAEVWSEIWSTLGPQAQAVLDGAGASWCEEQLLLMERNQFLEETYFTYSYSPIPDDGGGVGGVFCACTEDTHRVLSQRRLRTLRALAEQATQAKSVHAACEVAAATMGGDPHDLPFALLYLLDGEGKRATLAGCTGLNPDSPACPAAVGLDDPEAPWPFRRVAEGGKAAEVTGLHEKFGPLPGGAWPDSPKRAVVLPMTRPGHAQLAGFVVAAVSPRLVFNDEYKGFVDLIAGHVATAVANARAYEEEKKRAEALAELDRAKTAFFSNVSHEFRTPLTLLLGPVEEALADAGEPPTPRQQERLEIARRNALRLQKLVNTLLDFSRIEAGRAQACFEPVELAAFTCDLASNFRSACDKAGLKLTVDCPPLSEPAFVDRGMWEKVVLNLLSNAFKFTVEGEIAVSVRQPGRAAELQVRDTGTGIPAEEMPRLFERFHRVENAGGRTHEGSGIGLALVQELVRLHGGSIRAESEVGRGTTFVVAVPLGSAHLPADRIAASRGLPDTVTAATPYVEEALRWLPDEGGATDRGISEPSPCAELPPTPDRPSAPDGGDDRPRVLVADDNADMRQYVVRLLADLYRVEAVPDGEAALRAARERPPDLILTDVMMPRLDGFGLLRELRADPRTSGVPVLLLSARAGEESRVEGLGAGADDYLVKPFGAREMLARVAAHLEVARVRRDAERRVTGILESIADGFVALDRDWRYTYVNAAADAVHGVPRAELLGRRVWEAFPATVGTPFERMCRQAAESGAAVEFDTHYAPHDRWYAVRAFPSADGLSIYFRDVTDRRRADEALRRSEERFRRYFELGLIGMAITAPDKGIVEVNEEICRILGYPRDELLRKSWAELTHPDDAAADVARFDRVMAGEIDGYVLDKRWVRKDGRIIDATISVKCVRDAAGAVDYFVALLQDVTDRKRAEEALARDAHILASVREAVVVTDLEGVVTYWNEGAERLFGWAAGEVRGRPYADRYPEPERSWLAAEIRRRAAGEEWAGEYQDRRKDGSRVWIDARVARFDGPDGRPAGILGVSRDVTDRRRAEDDLRRARDELEARVAERTAELAAALASLEAAAARRADLSRRLAAAQEGERRRVARDLHDQVGQQLTAMTLGLQAARDRGADPATLARLQQMAEEVARGVHDVALRLRPTALDDFGLAEALRSGVEEWGRAGGAAVALDTDGLGAERLPAEMETALYRVVQEAVHNALKHAGARRVNVLVERRRRDVTAIVEDDGAGFDADAVLTRPPAGRLGLVGMRERLALVGGTLEVESARGAGTTVFARVPLPEGGVP